MNSERSVLVIAPTFRSVIFRDKNLVLKKMIIHDQTVGINRF